MARPLGTILEAVSAALLALLAANATIELVAWIIWQHSFAALDELQALLMVWFGMLSAAACLVRGLHLAVDLFGRRLAGRGKWVFDRLPPLAVACFGVLLAWYGWRLVALLDNTLPGTGWSASLQYQPVAAAGLVIAAIGLWQVRAPVAAANRSAPEFE